MNLAISQLGELQVQQTHNSASICQILTTCYISVGFAVFLFLLVSIEGSGHSVTIVSSMSVLALNDISKKML